jgi:LacI family transcriptional regulator
VVLFDRPVMDPALDSVTVQNMAGTRRMIEHLIGHGHRSIAFMGLSRSLYTINQRFLGYRKAMQTAGFEEDAVFSCGSQEDTLRLVETKLRGPNPPTAVMTSNTLATRYVLAALLHLGVKMPGELAIAGFDDFDMAEFMSPPLTVVRQPAQEMGRVATNLLVERMARGEVPQTGNRIVLPVEMVLRRSCGCKHRLPLITH